MRRYGYFIIALVISVAAAARLTSLGQLPKFTALVIAGVVAIRAANQLRRARSIESVKGAQQALIEPYATQLGLENVTVRYRYDTNSTLDASAQVFLQVVNLDDETLDLPEDQRDAVIAHELGHLTSSGYSTRFAAVSIAVQTLQVLTVAALAANVWNSRWAALFATAGVCLLAQLGVGVAMLAMRRAEERHADAVACRLGLGAPLAAALQRHARHSGMPQWLSTHPSAAERIGSLLRSA